MPAPVASGWSGCRVGLAPTGKAPPCHGARGNVGHWKWRNTSFPRDFWKSFPTDLLEMEGVQGSRHFQISKAIFTNMKAGPAGWTPRMPHCGWGRPQTRRCRSLSSRANAADLHRSPPENNDLGAVTWVKRISASARVDRTQRAMRFDRPVNGASFLLIGRTSIGNRGTDVLGTLPGHTDEVGDRPRR